LSSPACTFDTPTMTMTMTATTTPYADGFAMPIRTAPHDATLLAWPVRRELWGEHLYAAKEEWAQTIRAIAAFEPVTVIANPGDADEVREHCGDVDLQEIPIDDSWVRDSGPIYVLDGKGRRAMVHFRFNGWGERYRPYERDADVPRVLAERTGTRRYVSTVNVEGGGISVDGEGTLITTRQYLANENRNPGMSEAEIAAELRATLGIEKVIWLEHGLVEDRDTDGHSDNVVQFVRPGVVLLQMAPSPENPNWERCRENRALLEGATDARGRTLEVVEMSVLPYAEFEGESYVVPYVNYYPVNGGIIAPAVGEDDAAGFALLGELFPDRRVVGVPSVLQAYGGGGIGCITQQVPAGRPIP